MADEKVGEEESDFCPENSAGVHHPDWESVTVEHDGGETYVDVTCIHCGRSGCVGTTKTLTDGISW